MYCNIWTARILGTSVLNIAKSSVVRGSHNSTGAGSFPHYCCLFPSPSTSINSQRLICRRFASSKLKSDADEALKANLFKDPKDRSISEQTSRTSALNDSLNPNEWRLIYANAGVDKMKPTAFPVGLILSAICIGGAAMAVSCLLAVNYTGQSDPSDLKLITIQFVIAVTVLIFQRKFRRALVNRIYQQIDHQQASDQKIRRYCMITFNALYRPKKFFYDHTQTSNAREIKQTMRLMFFGNFKANGRAFAVFPQHFADHDNYFLCRMSTKADSAIKESVSQ